MVFNATLSNISVISWRSVLLVKETGDPEKTTDLPQVTDKLDHIMLYTSPWSRFEQLDHIMLYTSPWSRFEQLDHIMLYTSPWSRFEQLYHIMLYTSPWSRFEQTISVVIGTDCIGKVVVITEVYKYLYQIISFKTPFYS
jgi:hypothetical protein